MANLLIDTQTVPAVPAAGKLVVFPNSTTKQLVARDDSGKFATLSGSLRNWNTADVVANAADTYLTGSGITVPTGQALQVGTTFRWTFGMTKTAAGTAAPVWIVRVGTAGTTADTARVTFTSPSLQTAAIDTGMVDIVCILRNVGGAGVLQGILTLHHALATTGFASLGSVVVQAGSVGFDTTVAGTIVGVSVNPGASGVWTHQVVMAEGLNL